MKIFLYKQELLFCQGDRYLWPHCCIYNLYISHRSLYAPTYSFSAIRSMLISLFRVTSWFDTVNNTVTRWMNFRENHLHEHDLQLFDYNIKKYCGLLKSCMLGRKVIYVRCISCSYNNVAKVIRLLDKKSNFCLYRKNFMQVRGFERYIPLKHKNCLPRVEASLLIKSIITESAPGPKT